MTKRRTITRLFRAKVFDASGGMCHICGGRITASDKWEVEHRVPLELGGADELENMHPAHSTCHSAKTKEDVARISKAKRQRAKFVSGKPKGKWQSRPFNQERFSNVKQLRDL